MPSPWERIAEDRINEVIARGEFNDVPKSAGPIDLRDYFAQPTEERMGLSLLKNAGVVPAEVELLRDVARIEEALATCQDPAVRQRLNEDLQARRVALAMASERRQQARRGGTPL